MPSTSRAITGARLRFYLGGKKAGYATDVEGEETIDYAAVECLDNIEPEEFAPLAYRVTLRAGFVRIWGEDPKGNNWMPKTGTTPEDHLLNILNDPGMTAILEDRKEHKPLETFQEVRISSRRISANARGLTAQNVEFVVKRNYSGTET